jgi:thioredoxin reductase (NADPH)
MDDALDCLIVGGGPAGLTALYLARYHRRVLLVDDDKSRARWIPTSHNCPGFPEGISGTAYLEQLRRQAKTYGVRCLPGRVEAVTAEGDGFSASTSAGRMRARTVLLATGIVDTLPEMAERESAIQQARLRLCPICDAYEASGQRIGVLGPRGKAEREADFLRTYSDAITILPTSAEAAEPGANPPGAAPELLLEEDAILARTGGMVQRFDCIYAAMGATVRSELGVPLGLHCTEQGYLITDSHQQCNVHGIFAAGDVVSELNQIAVATGHAAIAATTIHNLLRQRDRDGAVSAAA